MAAALKVRFRVHPARDTSRPPLEPLVAFEGGPGYGSITSAYLYAFMMGPLRQNHPLIVMDQRGTGSSSTLDCPRLQQDDPHYVQAVQACADQLGPASAAYGSSEAADDMAAIMKALDYAKVNVYGDSYGTYLAQVFALQHPDMVRTLVLDGTFDDSFDPFARDAAAAIERSWPIVCKRAHTCPGILSSLSSLSRELERHPLTGVGMNPDGRKVPVHVDGRDVTQLAYDATYVFTIYQDLPAAIKALHHGDATPFLRLAAEDLANTSSGSHPRGYSSGAYMAVSCADYPVAWDPSASFAERRKQLDEAIADLAPNSFAPFSKNLWLHSLYEYQLVYGCLRWPEPAATTPTKADHPSSVPVLTINGQFDITTPMQDAVMAANAWPNSTLVRVANELHVAALYDYPRCASLIFRHFIRTSEAGDTSCSRDTRHFNVIPKFPETLAGAPSARASGSGASPEARQAAWVAAATIGDAYTRWWNTLWGYVGSGLRGGTFAVHGPYMAWGPLRLSFRRTQFVGDMSIRGSTTWHRRSGQLAGTIEVSGPDGLTGTLHISGTTLRNEDAHLRGVLRGQRVDLRAPIPFQP
jgi:pimeloyl-ACP methyl ester carboxylesterase